MKDRLFDIWFSLRVGIANREFRPVLEKYKSTYDLFEAEAAELATLPCSENLRRALADKSVEESYRILHYCEQNGVSVIFWKDETYPDSLRNLPDPPVILYVKGKLPDMGRRLAVSVVGTRKMSEYGKRMAYKIGYELGAARAVVVSGMALGIDSVAAAGAITAGGQTVAVLGCGIDLVYPAEHTRLCREIEGHGAVVTEFPPSTPPAGCNFPIRNRIISGLSLGVLVGEAPAKSGSLITAGLALDQGRDVFAVPGSVDAHSSDGCNELIARGAKLVRDAKDVLEEYVGLYTFNQCAPEEPPVGEVTLPKPKPKSAEPKPAAVHPTLADVYQPKPAADPVLDALEGILSLEELCARCGMDTSQMLSKLTLLELQGKVRQLPGQCYEKI